MGWEVDEVPTKDMPMCEAEDMEFYNFSMVFQKESDRNVCKRRVYVDL